MSEGQVVEAGTIMVVIDRDAASKNLIHLRRFERDRLLEKRQMLLSARNLEKQTLLSQASGLLQLEKKVQIVAQLNRDATTSAGAREKLLQDEIKRTKGLRDAGFISEAAERSRTAEYLDAVRVERAAQAQIVTREVDDFKDIKALSFSMAETRRQMQIVEAQLLDVERELERDLQTAVEQVAAARSGRVVQILHRPGEVVREGDIVAIVGDDSRESKVEIYVPAYLADTVFRGQRLLLRDSHPESIFANQTDRYPTLATITELTSVSLDASSLRMPVSSEGRFVLVHAESVRPVPSGRALRARLRVGAWSLFDLAMRPYRVSSTQIN
jgi:biotin carboxyl carrier protein